MKPRMFLALAMLLVLLMAGSVLAAADGATVPFKAPYACLPRIVGFDANGCMIQELPCVGQATHLGESTWYSDGRSCGGQSGSQGGINATWTAANGDTLYGRWEGTYRFNADWSFVSYEGTYYIEDGDGRFAGYTGTGRYWGSSPMDGTGELYFEGTLTKPGEAGEALF